MHCSCCKWNPLMNTENRLFPSSLLAAFYVPVDYHPASPLAYFSLSSVLLHVILLITGNSSERTFFLNSLCWGISEILKKTRYSIQTDGWVDLKGWKHSSSLFTWKKISLLYFFEVPLNYFHTKLVVPNRLFHCVEASHECRHLTLFKSIHAEDHIVLVNIYSMSLLH